MFEAIMLVWVILFISMLGILLDIPEIYIILINFLFTLWMAMVLFRLKAPFFPSSKKTIEFMMKLAHIQAGDTVYELGSGDGRILRAAYVYRPGKIVWYELSPRLVWYSRFLNSLRKERIVYKREDLFQQDLSDADVIFCFLLPQGMEKIEQEIRPKLRPWTKVISNIFAFQHIEYTNKEWLVYYYQKE